MLAAYLFLLPVIGGFLAGCSAVLLRRAASIMGAWLEVLAAAAALASVAAFGWGLYWAWALAPADEPSSPGRVFLGLALALAGGSLAGWGLRARGWRPRRIWRSERDELRQPYRTIRRPVVLGVMFFGLGLGVLADRSAFWFALAATFAAWSVILELADWEQRLRLPACRDYMRRTPRYVPRPRLRLRGSKRPSESG